MKLLRALLLFFAITSFASLAVASPDWNNTTGSNGTVNNYNNPLNWDPNNVPGSNDSAHIFPGFTVTTVSLFVTSGGVSPITINSTSNDAVDSLLVSSNFDGANVATGVLNLSFTNGSTYAVGTGGVVYTGSVTVNFSGNQTVSGDFIVGTTSSTIDPGQVTGPATLNLGTGTLNLDAGTANSFVVGQTASGVVNQNAGSVVITGPTLTIGSSGTGTYTVNSGATLDIGDPLAPASPAYTVNIGSTSGSTGTLNLADGSTLNAMNPNTTIQVGGGTGSVIQNGTVNLGGAGSSLLIGAAGGYQLQSGALNLGTNGLDTVTLDIDGTGATLTQSGGTLTAGAATTVIVGDASTGAYNLSGGTADFQNGLIVGNQAAGNGTVTQSAGTLTAENVVTVGVVGAGTYNLSGGTATFSNGLLVGATGTFNQTGGTVTMGGGQTLDLTTAGSTYNLNGGTLQVASNLTGAGTFNFGGGTLQPTAGPFTDSLSGSVNGTSTLDTTNANMTLSGTLNGVTGSAFNVIGGGAVTFSGANSGSSWGVNILNGTVNASASTFPSSGSVAIGSNGAGATGTFNLAVAGGAPHLFTGNITSIGNAGTGAFHINFATAGDTLELAGSSNSYNGQTTLAGGGTLRVFNGSFGSLGGNGAVAIGGDTAVATSGTVNFTGTNSYTGLTTVNNGFTLLTSNLAGNLNVTNLGTIGSGLTPATLPTIQATTVNLGGTFNSTGNILLNSNGNTTDLYTVTGASTLSGKVVLSGVGTTTNHVFINSPAGLNTAGLTLVTAGQGVLFTGSIQQIGNTEVLTTTQNPTASFAQTPNQQAVSTVIDPILTGTTIPAGATPILAGLNNLNASQIPAGLEQLTPESLQYARDIAFENSTFLAQRMNNVCADLRAGYGGLDTSMINVVAPGFDSGMGRSLGSFFAYNDPSFHSAAPNGVNYYPGGESTSPAAINGTESDTPAPAAAPWDSSRNVISDSPNPYLANSNPAGPETPRLSEFISGDVVLADLNTNQNTSNAASSKASYTAGDVTAGISFRMTSHLAAGVLFDYNHTDAKTDSSGSKTQIDSYSPGLFATYYDHGFYANGLFSFGYNNYSNKRNIGFLGDTASSSPSGQQYVGNLDLGYDFKPAKGWIAGPTLGMTYTHLDVDSFTETGAPGADLAVDSQSADSFRTRLGGHVGYSTNTGDVLLTPNFTAMWQHEFLDNSSGITSSFNDFSSNSFTIQTAAPSRDSALIGIGLSATLSNSMTLYFNYLADVGATNYFAQSVVGGFKARF